MALLQSRYRPASTRLLFTPPPHPQDCSGPNSARPHRQNLHLCHRQGCRKGACHQSPQQQRLPEGGCRPEPAPTSLLTLPPLQQETPKAVVTLPYIRHLLESICWILIPLGICTCFRPYQTLRRTLVHLKDRIEPERRAGVVYRIPCRACAKMYIGQTGRTLEHRLKEHRRALVSGR